MNRNERNPAIDKNLILIYNGWLVSKEPIMSGEGEPRFDPESVREEYEAIPEFRELQADTPDALAMVTSIRGEAGLTAKEWADYWDNIGRGDGGFYDSIRANGCSSCGSHTPGCCDGCA